MPQVTDGDGEAVLSMATLRERFANPQELVGHSLYVSVTVLTESGGGVGGGHRGLGGEGQQGHVTPQVLCLCHSLQRVG